MEGNICTEDYGSHPLPEKKTVRPSLLCLNRGITYEGENSATKVSSLGGEIIDTKYGKRVAEPEEGETVSMETKNNYSLKNSFSVLSLVLPVIYSSTMKTISLIGEFKVI